MAAFETAAAWDQKQQCKRLEAAACARRLVSAKVFKYVLIGVEQGEEAVREPVHRGTG